MALSEKEIGKYTWTVMEIQGALENLTEWASTLPAPDCNDELPTTTREHLAALEKIKNALYAITGQADEYSEI